MEKMTKTYVIFHVLVLVSCCIALLVKTENKHTAKYVFTDVDSTSGWTPVGFSYLFGFLSVSWGRFWGSPLCLTSEYLILSQNFPNRAITDSPVTLSHDRLRCDCSYHGGN